jgi:hypothetical protein
MDRWRSARRVVRGMVILAAPLGIVILTVSGCGSLTPRNFRAMLHPAPVVRAGAVSLYDDQPDAVAIPAWIARLNDKDEVVRMATIESLKKRTGQDFGYVAWAEPPERAAAVAKWQAWWKAKSKGASQGGLVTRRRNG